MRLLWLADELRAAGMDVIEVEGWRTRGSDSFSPRGIVCHHTATPEKASGDYPSLNIVKNGRSDLPGPLAQLGLGRSGKVYVIASGRANHAGTGGWKGMSGNSSVVGIEAEDSGDSVWFPIQLAAYKTLCAVLVRKMGIPVSNICGHKEWAPSRKIDPAGINMDTFRSEVSDILTGATPIAKTEEDELIRFIGVKGDPAIYGVWGIFRTHIPNPDIINGLVAAGLAKPGTVMVAPGVRDSFTDIAVLHSVYGNALAAGIKQVEDKLAAPSAVVHKLEIQAKVVE